jgi:uncharacterized membrane protein
MPAAVYDCFYRDMHVLLMMMWMMRGHHHAGSGALNILNERYARGEINEAEHEERRRVLRS